MSLTQELISNYREIRTRLRNPPNAVFDHGINLHRTLIPITELSSKDIIEVLEPSNPIHCRVIIEEIPKPPVEPIIPRKLRLTEIEEAVCHHYRVPLQTLRGRRKQTWIIDPRHMTFYLACKHTGQSLPRIARMYKRDHTTILHAKRKLEELLLVDDKIIQTVRLLETILFNRTVSVSDVASH